MQLGAMPRVRLAHLPTPLEETVNLRRALGGGPRLFFKRDDATGLALGGNKARKLEFLVADALAKGADTLITTGGAQSNHARMTAAAANRFGLKTVLVLTGSGAAPRQGNLLMDHVLGAEVRFTTGEAAAAMEEVAAGLSAQGKRPYIIPIGGSHPMGALGYVACVQELAAQAFSTGVRVDHIVMATGSGGTQAGLELGVRLFHLGQVTGISVSREKSALASRVADIAQGAVSLLGMDLALDPAGIRVFDEYIGEGYAKVTPEGLSSIGLVARTEGVILDPVYTGKAMAGMLDLWAKGAFGPDETVVFLHTGGVPSLFAYAEHF
ncbi:MAG TPA: D-cysteine desulfhydrase family protein [Clostridiales bacterium UBA8153]|nr:D-cysteine desulfhydrase family protein [Clostridiales bacterium UBA8153]